MISFAVNELLSSSSCEINSIFNSRSKLNSQSQIEAGKFANIEWKAIPLEHLRTHPLYRSLPCNVYDVDTVHGFAHCNIFRQDSWQWDALHTGRLTTSKMSCCLGFYESFAAETLNIPRSLISHDKVVNAWMQLTKKPI